jgi:hypothetical protein
MRQRIFSMGLTVEAVSVYLLCCAIVDAGGTITRTALQDKWNGRSDALDRELGLLEDRQILGRESSGGQAVAAYRLTDEKHWR